MATFRDKWGRDKKCRFCREIYTELELDPSHGGCNDCMTRYF